MENAATYKRSQVEWALWRFFLQGRPAASGVPKVFLTRIKRLLEVDRGEDLESEMPAARFAFSDTSPEGKGTDVRYRPFDAFCLALALELLDAGFKQAEIVFLLRHLRGELETWFERILSSPPSARQRLRPEHRPGAPAHVDADGRAYADCRVFVVVKKVEIKEIFQSPRAKKLDRGPLFLRPVYCRGIEALCEELDRMAADNRKAMVIEIAHAAASVSALLPRAPLTRRGRG